MAYSRGRSQSMAVMRTLDKYFDLGCTKASCKGLASRKHPSKSRTLHEPVAGYQKALKRCKDLDPGVCLSTIIPNTSLAQAVLEQSLEKATPMINQGNKNHTSSLPRHQFCTARTFSLWWLLAHTFTLDKSSFTYFKIWFLFKLYDKKSSLRQHRKLLN